MYSFLFVLVSCMLCDVVGCFATTFQVFMSLRPPVQQIERVEFVRQRLEFALRYVMYIYVCVQYSRARNERRVYLFFLRHIRSLDVG